MHAKSQTKPCYLNSIGIVYLFDTFLGNRYMNTNTIIESGYKINIQPTKCRHYKQTIVYANTINESQLSNHFTSMRTSQPKAFQNTIEITKTLTSHHDNSYRNKFKNWVVQRTILMLCDAAQIPVLKNSYKKFTRKLIELFTD